MVMDNEWLVWLNENLGRSCNPSAIYDVMRTNGFSVKAIKELMGDAFPVGLDRGMFPSSVDYQALANVLERPDAHPRLQRVETDLLQIYTIEDFLTPEECAELIRRAEGNLTLSRTTHYSDDKDFRTSTTCHLNRHADPFVEYIDDKISTCLGIRWPYSEPIQMQHYALGEQLKGHHDYFEMAASDYSRLTGKAGQRTWTFVVYLNTVEKGGETYFPYIDCKFRPKQGTAALWNDLFPDGVPNRNTLHSSLPVECGEKFIITKWFRERGFGPMFF
jgi:prolyl 4-hydroxylase